MSALRVALAWLAASAALPGLWATLAPRSFFDDFPGPQSWVAPLPPFSAHLTSDVGAFYLAFGALFAWAAFRPDRALVVPLALAWALFSVLHLGWHVAHLEGFGAAEGASQTASLVLVLAVPVLVLALARRRS